MRVFSSVLLGVLLLAAQPTFAQNFSVVFGQPDTAGGLPPGDDILGPGPGLVLPGGLLSPPPISEVDAFSAGRTFFPTSTANFFFSVDSFATGAPGTAVMGQSASGEAQTDVFSSIGGGSNALYHDGDGSTISAGGALGLSEGPPFGISSLGVDAYEQNPAGSFPGPLVYWSVDTPTAFSNPVYTGGGALPADIFLSPPVPGYAAAPAIYASAAMLGLSTTDDIDALEVYDFGTIGVFDPVDVILFSLTPGSPTVLGGGVAPGDILASSGGGSFGLFLPDIALGLAPGDNLNALSVAVPEPSAFAALALGCLGLLRRRRR